MSRSRARRKSKGKRDGGNGMKCGGKEEHPEDCVARRPYGVGSEVGCDFEVEVNGDLLTFAEILIEILR